MEKAQFGFGEERKFNTFEHKQGAIYATNKSNKIKESLILYEELGDSYYYRQDVLKSFFISGMVTMMPNGVIKAFRVK